MRHSNYREALQRIIQQDILGSSVGSSSPVGTTHLRAILRRNPETQQLLTREALLDSAEGLVNVGILAATPRPLGGTFRPDRWGKMRKSTGRF